MNGKFLCKTKKAGWAMLSQPVITYQNFYYDSSERYYVCIVLSSQKYQYYNDKFCLSIKASSKSKWNIKYFALSKKGMGVAWSVSLLYNPSKACHYCKRAQKLCLYINRLNAITDYSKLYWIYQQSGHNIIISHQFQHYHHKASSLQVDLLW